MLRIAIKCLFCAVLLSSCAIRRAVDPQLFTADGRGAKGSPNARVRITEFADFTCKFCKRQSMILDRLSDEFGDQVEIVFRYLPHNAEGELAARASYAAMLQGNFWEMHDLLFENQNSIDEALINDLVQALNLDPVEFARAMSSAAADRALRDDAVLAAQNRIWGIPWLVINGESISGVVELATLRRMVRSEIAKGSSPQSSTLHPFR